MDLYNYYLHEYKGKLCVDKFEDLLIKSKDIIEMYINSLVLNPVTLIALGDVEKAICYEVDCLSAYGLDSLNGTFGENDVELIKTDNYEIKKDRSKEKYFLINGLPLSPMTKNLIYNLLFTNGYLSRVVNQ